MPRYRRVSWRITATTTTKANTLKTTIDTALAGKATQRVAKASTRAGTVIDGDYLFTLATAADTVYTTVNTALAGADAVSGYCQVHDCDHDAQERSTMTGCTPVARNEKGL